jgi:2-polyprenyl-3-methyl-5-hydroxy-6-metoxy-1,4-benzoquinol methylase
MSEQRAVDLSFEKRTGRDKYFAALEREILQLVDPATGLLSREFSRLVACSICQEDLPETLFVKRGYTFVRCQNCGHIYANPQVIPERVAETYRHSEANEYWTEVLLNTENQAWQIPYFNSLLDIVEAHAPAGKLLDVGCSVGLFMDAALLRGWQAIGLELGTRASEYARGKGLDVRQQFLEDVEFEEESFDSITALSLMEHLNDPVSFVQTAHRLLRTNGVFAAISPNTYSLASIILREKLPTFDGRNHLQYYTLNSFKRLFEQNGYRVVHLDTVLTALPNIKKYIQFKDPYGEESPDDLMPSNLKDFFFGSQKEEFEAFIYRNHLGLRLRIVAQRI